MTVDYAPATSADIARSDSIAASPLRRIRVGLIGLGQIGQAVATLAESSRPRFAAAGLDVQCVAALVRDRRKPRRAPALPLHTEPDQFFAERFDVVIEVMGGIEPARALVTRALERGCAVVSANKSLVSAHGPDLRARAAAHGAVFAFDAAVLAGVPFIGSLSRRPLVSAVRRVSGVLNGTSHFIVNAIARGGAFAGALARAQADGYAEPDPSADISGRDAAEKLSVLLQLAGTDAPASLFPAASIDGLSPADFAAARAFGGTIKPVACAEIDGAHAGAWVGPAFVPDAHPFARLDGVTNAVQLVREDGEATTFIGAGAGPRVTALTILDDVAEAACAGIGRPVPVPGPEGSAATRRALARPPACGWIIRLDGAATWRATAIEQQLTDCHTSVLRLFSSADRWFAQVAPAPWTQVQYAATGLRGRGAGVTLWPVLP